MIYIGLRHFTTIYINVYMSFFRGRLVQPPIPFLSSLSQEMQEVNVAIAHAAVTDKLSGNPFIQGLLLKCMTRLDRESRGIETNRGRAPKRSETESSLIADAAITLAVAGGNKLLLKELGQNQTCPRINAEDLPSWSLPNPCLALMHQDQLRQNIELVDQQFPRAPSTPTQRLICAMDGTYLQKALQQMKFRGVAGLVGGPWSPHDESLGFIPLDKVPDSAPYAHCMVQFLVFDPAAEHRKSFPIASMPMGLAPPVPEGCTKSHAGNIDTCIILQTFS